MCLIKTISPLIGTFMLASNVPQKDMPSCHVCLPNTCQIQTGLPFLDELQVLQGKKQCKNFI